MGKKLKKIKKHLLLGILCIAAVMLAGVISLLLRERDKRESYISTISTLKEVIAISDLSTYTAVYNGVAAVYGDTEEKSVDFYVSYEARVHAGIDFSKITFHYDVEENSITMTIPDITLTELFVDAGSMDYIFVNQSANTSTVSSVALKACEEDVRSEAGEQEAITELAYENAVNVLQALVMPVIEYTIPDGTLNIR